MKLSSVAVAAALLLLVSSSANAQQSSPVNVDLKDASGQSVGTATLTQSGSGVQVQVQVQGLAEGEHGIHFHAVGQCQPQDFMSAGGHFNPLNRQHGLQNPSGAHAGDLPNLEVGANGSGTLSTLTDRVTLGTGPASVFDADGTALVIHAGPDDHVTDPAGNSGARVACGIVAQAAAPSTGAAPAAQPAAPAAAPAPAPGTLPRTGLAIDALAPLGAALGGVVLGVGAWVRRRAR